MRILVTGGAGFIGSHIADAYVAAGHQVTVVDDFSSGQRRNVNAKAECLRMDIRDPNLISIFEKHRFDVVNHHAAQIDVRRSVQDPFFDASVNIIGTLRLLECARACGVRKFIFASSGGVMYGECQKPALESQVPGPVSPYGLSKLAAEKYIQFYGQVYGLDYTILRYGNVYGPRQDPHGEAGVVAIFSGRLLRNEGVTIFGTGNQVRDYVYVKDIARANLLALRRGSRRILNIGTSRTTSVNELFHALAKVSGVSKGPRYAARRKGELERSWLNAGLARRQMGWKPQVSLRDGLRETLEFFRNSAQGSSHR